MTRYLSAFAALAALLSASGALAADMPGSYPRPVYAPPPTSCGQYGERPAAHVWEPGQTAYIVAESCADHTLSAWLHKFHISPRVPLRVYYNGGSMWRTDINTIDVPPQTQLY